MYHEWLLGDALFAVQRLSSMLDVGTERFF